MTTLKTDYIPTAQEALVDPVLLSNVNDFYTGKSVPSIVTILDLFSLAEALVLFDRLIAPIEWRVSKGFEEIDLSYLGNLSNKIAFNDDLNWFSVDYGIPNDEALDYAMNFCFGIDKRFSSQWKQLGALPIGKDFSLEISDTLNIFHRAWKWKCDFVASPLWQMFFMSEEKPLATQPKELYKKLSSNLKKEIAQLQAMKYPTHFYIPPIPAVALQKCEGEISNFWFEVEKIRKNFSACRKKYAEYQKVIANPDDKPLGELIQKRREAVSEVEGELARLVAKRTDSRILMEMWDSTAEVNIGGNAGNIEFSTGIFVASLIGKSLGWIKHWTVKGRARSLFNIYKKTLSIKGYDKLLVKTFNLQQKDIERQTQMLALYLKDANKATNNSSPNSDWSC